MGSGRMMGAARFLAPRAAGAVADALVRVSVLACIGVLGHVAFASAPGGDDAFLALHVVFGGLHAALVLLCRRTRTAAATTWLGHGVLLVNNAGMAVALTLEGPHSGAIFFLPLNAAFALLQFGRRGGTFWVLVSVALVVLHASGGLPLDITMPPGLQHDPLVEQVFAILLMAFVAAMFRRALDRRIHDVEQARADALQAAASRDRFLATLTHELRTPLVGALGTARLLIDEGGPPGVVSELREIEATGTRLQDLLDGLLEQTRGRAQATSPAAPPPEPVLRVRRSLRVLVIEDNPTNAAVTHGMLVNLGHLPRVVSTGQAGLEALTQHEFDAVLLDLRLPDLSGYEVFAAMPSGLHVVALTASTDEREQVRAAGMNGFLAKPCRLEELDEALQT